MGYTHLTEDGRYTSYEKRKEGCTHRVIGRLLGREASTISRELTRNRRERGYRPRQAYVRAKARRACVNRYGKTTK